MTSGVKRTVSIGLASEASAFQRSKGTIFLTRLWWIAESVFSYAGRAVAQTDVAIAPAGFAELDEASIFKGLHEDRQFITRRSSV